MPSFTTPIAVVCALLATGLPLAARADDAPRAKVQATPRKDAAASRDAAPASAQTLETAIDRLRAATGANIVPMWGAIEKAGIRRDTPVELHLKRVSAAQLLRLTLDVASAGQEADNRLGYAIEDGIVIIAPRRDLAERTVTRSYDVRDLTAGVPNFTDAPSLSLTTVLSGIKEQ